MTAQLRRAAHVARTAILATAIVALTGMQSICLAHIGSPDTWYEGPAGAYPLRVIVRAPSVVPGLADITVRVLDGHATRVTAAPYIWNGGDTGAPPPDVAKPVPGDAQLFSVPLWFMTPSSYSVRVNVEGDRGSGTAVVPVQAVALRRLGMQKTLGVTLAILGIFLVVLALSIVYGAAKESGVPPGATSGANSKARSLYAVAGAAVILAVAATGGRFWWSSVDRDFQRTIYKPFTSAARVIERGTARGLDFEITDPVWRGRRWSPLIPDHGKLMHMFLIREPGFDAIAHLHPVPTDSSHFEVCMPPVPEGQYHVYADIVHESGFTRTLTATVDVPAPNASNTASATAAAADTAAAFHTDPDDSWYVSPSGVQAASPGERVALANGATMTWEAPDANLVEGRDAGLRFAVRNADGTAAAIEPYMGMLGHAIVRRDDGSVFVHLHPIGTVSMASQMALMMRAPSDSVPGMLGRRMSAPGHMEHMMGGSMSGLPHEPGVVMFPYGFAQAGAYHIWVQIKMNGQILTGAFAATVKPPPPA